MGVGVWEPPFLFIKPNGGGVSSLPFLAYLYGGGGLGTPFHFIYKTREGGGGFLPPPSCTLGRVGFGY